MRLWAGNVRTRQPRGGAAPRSMAFRSHRLSGYMYPLHVSTRYVACPRLRCSNMRLLWSTLGIISTDTTISGHRLVVDKAHRVAEGVGFHPRVYDPRILGYAPSAPCWSSESTSYASLTLTTLLATLPALSNGQQHTHGDRVGGPSMGTDSPQPGSDSSEAQSRLHRGSPW